VKCWGANRHCVSGVVPVKGKKEKMKLFTVTSLLEEPRLAELRRKSNPYDANAR